MLQTDKLAVCFWQKTQIQSDFLNNIAKKSGKNRENYCKTDENCVKCTLSLWAL
jgi:hypothetical protein